MAELRGVEIPIKITADTAGGKQAASDLAIIRDQVMELARANGLTEASAQKVGAVYDELLGTMEALDREVATGALEAEDAMRQWTQAMTEAEREVTRLNAAKAKSVTISKQEQVEIDRLAKRLRSDLAEGARRAEQEQQRLLKMMAENEQAMARARMEQEKTAGSFDHVSKSTQKVGNQLHINTERVVMMGQVVGGLTAQLISGGDAMTLFTTGATHMAMVLSTGGKWGLTAGFAVTMLTNLVAYLNRANVAARKAAEEGFKEVTNAIVATHEAIRQIDDMAATNALRKHAEWIEDITKAWDDTAEALARYYRMLDRKAGAELAAKQAALELEKQGQLDRTTDPLERERVEKQYQDRAAQLQFEADVATKDRERERLEAEKKRAELALKEADENERRLQREQEVLGRQKAGVRPDGVKSDQQKIVDENNDILLQKRRAEQEAARLREIVESGGGQRSDVVAMHRHEAKIAELESALKERQAAVGRARSVIDVGNETYDTATPEQKEGAVKNYEAEKKRLADAEEDLRKQRRDLDGQRKEAREVIADKNAELDINKVERGTVIDRSRAQGKVTGRELDDIAKREKERHEAEQKDPMGARTNREVEEATKGVQDAQERARIEADVRKKAAARPTQEAAAAQQAKQDAYQAKSAAGRKEVADGDLAAKVRELAGAATDNTGVSKEVQAQLKAAADAFRDGADKEELARLAVTMQGMAKSQDSGIQGLMVVAKEALERSIKAEKEIEKLKAKARQNSAMTD